MQVVCEPGSDVTAKVSHCHRRAQYTPSSVALMAVGLNSSELSHLQPLRGMPSVRQSRVSVIECSWVHPKQPGTEARSRELGAFSNTA